MPRVPLRWLAEHVDLAPGTTPQDVAAALVRVGLEEEALHGPQVTGPLVVGEVLEVTPEPQKNGKTIMWCQVDVGPVNVVGDDHPDGAPRGIVCGADNFTVGDRVVVALPGTVLPGPFPISARKTYGHVSDGMICSARELGIGEDHSGIIVLERYGYTAENGYDTTPGTDAAALLGLDESVLEVNVTPDRGYCFSVRGIAREYAHATGAAFRDPAAIEVPPATDDGYPVVLADDAPVRGVPGCDRFVARIVRGVNASAPAPPWMQRRLTQAGMRPISLAVDVTNYVMLDLGQPLHAYDLTKVHGPIQVRRGRPGERLVTLDDVERVIDPEDLLITDSGPGGEPASRVLGLAGVMGGAAAEVSGTTTDVLIEGAHFDPVTVARTSRRHRLSSEASRRFERGVDPDLPAVAVQRVVDLLVEYGGGTADPAVTDVDARTPRPAVRLPADVPARVVGVPYTTEQVTETLEMIGCHVAREPGTGVDLLVVDPPSWRPDLVAPEDLVEEVARLRGYDAIPSVLPVAPAGRGLTAQQRARRSVARALAEHGLVEVLSYPFVGADVHDALGIPADDERRRTLTLVNPLSDQAPLLRTSVLSTLLDTVRRNIGRGASDVAVFEIGLVTRPGDEVPPAPRPDVSRRPTAEEIAALDAAVPPQPRHIAGVLTGDRVPGGVWGPGRPVDHGDAIGAAQLVAETVGVPVELAADTDRAPWHPGRCARVTLGDGTLVGHAGELHPKVLERLDLPPRTVAFELDLDVLLAAAPTAPRVARPVSPYPVGKEDIALVVDADVPAAEVLAAVRDGAGELAEAVRLFDVYTGAQVGEGKKSLAFALRLRAPDRTLTAQEAADVRAAAVAEAERRVGAVLRST